MTDRHGFLERLLDHADDLRWQDIPQEVREKAARFFADTIGVGISARELPETLRLRGLALSWGPGEIVPLGGGDGLTAPQAAFVNGFQIHCQEFDAVHEPAVVHAMSVVTAALLAEIQQRDCSGARFLEALVLGVDTAVTLGVASRAPMRFFRPATAGLMGATLAVMKLREADRPLVQNALGLAYSHLSGTMQAHVEGSPALAFQIAIAARNALFAADMACAGCPGPQDVVEGPFGYLNLIEGHWQAEECLARLGRQWAIAELSHKPQPTGRAAHGVLQMFDDVLIEEGLTKDDIAAIRADVPPLIRRLVDRPYDAPLALSQARLCLPFLVATRLLTGKVDLTSVTPEWIDAPDWRKAAKLLEIRVDDNPDPNALVPQRLVVRTTDGREFEKRADAVFGAPENPLSPERQFEKFRACLEFAGRGSSSERLWRELLAIADAPSVRRTMQQFETST